VKDAKSALGVAIVAIAALLVAVAGARTGAFLVATVAGLAAGLFTAAAAFALFGYHQGRDPTLLLVGAGTAAAAVVGSIVPAMILFIPSPGPGLLRRLGFTTLAALLGLLGNLLTVVPWKERRGRPPLQPAKVVVATIAGLAGYALLAAVVPVDLLSSDGSPLGPLGWLSMGALLVGGAIVTVRSLQWGGRFGWVAAAGLALSFVGLGSMLLPIVSGSTALRIASAWADLGRALAAGSLVVFVLASLRIESSRQRRVSDRAAEVMEGRAEIAATIAHDVRGPVGTIKGLATTTRKSYDRLGDEQRLEFIGMIEHESARLLRLVDQVAVGLKVDAGTLAISPRLQEVAPLVHAAVADTDTEGRTVEVDAPPDVRAEVDPRWFVDAVQQGLDNALGFSPADTPVVVTVRKTADDGALVTITDRGPGVPAEQREAVFDKFVRWRPTGYEDRQGSGLGLFICRGVARAHGGDASLEAAPEGGTMLRVRFPREASG
jgi:signal transduction histidine kinase